MQHTIRIIPLFCQICLSNIFNKEIYIIYLSQLFSGYNWVWNPKTDLDVCRFFLSIEKNLFSFLKATKALCEPVHTLDHIIQNDK